MFVKRFAMEMYGRTAATYSLSRILAAERCRHEDTLTVTRRKSHWQGVVGWGRSLFTASQWAERHLSHDALLLGQGATAIPRQDYHTVRRGRQYLSAGASGLMCSGRPHPLPSPFA